VELPPLDGLVSANTIFRFWISETRADFRMRRPEETNEWIYEPLRLTETLRFADTSSFIYYMEVDLEEDNEVRIITSTLSLWYFRLFFRAEKNHRYEFIPNPVVGGRWEQYGEPVLHPNEMSLSYRRNFLNNDIIRNRLGFSFNVDSSLVFNLRQHTSSNFQFGMGFNLLVNNFLDIRLTATSQNNVIFRYFKGIPAMDHLTFMYIDGPQNNLFVDLLDSFNFFNEGRRQRSGFKMRSFDLTAIHFLGDWTAELGIRMYTFQNMQMEIPRYQVTADVNFLVQWKPITEIKTDIEYRGELERWSRN
jgi:hypothetical protein